MCRNRRTNSIKAFYSTNYINNKRGFCYQNPLLYDCDSEGIRTLDPQLRRLLLYPTELLNHPLFAGAKVYFFNDNSKDFRYFLIYATISKDSKKKCNGNFLYSPSAEGLAPRRLSKPPLSVLPTKETFTVYSLQHKKETEVSLRLRMKLVFSSPVVEFFKFIDYFCTGR